MTQTISQKILPRPSPAPDRGPLDDRFYEYPDDLTACLYAYVQANRSQIQGIE